MLPFVLCPLPDVPLPWLCLDGLKISCGFGLLLSNVSELATELQSYAVVRVTTS